MCTSFTTTPGVVIHMKHKNYPKRKPTTVMDRHSIDKIKLGILQKKLEAKVKYYGIRVFTCEILPGGVVNMGTQSPTNL